MKNFIFLVIIFFQQLTFSQDCDHFALKTDITNNPALGPAIEANPDLIVAWKILNDLGEAVIPAVHRSDPTFLIKFNNVASNNNLGLDAEKIGEILQAPSLKLGSNGLPLSWENLDAVLDAIERASDSGVNGITVTHKKFPEPTEGNTSFILSNAKQYQMEASGDAGLSFDIGGRSFDNVTYDGVLIDRKYGHGASVFNSDGTVKNQSRAQSILSQGQAQVDAASGATIKWEVSTELGAEGIQELFDLNGIDIEVVYVAQQTIIN